MERGMNKVVIVTRKTRLAELIHKYNTLEQARFYIEHMGVCFQDYIDEDTLYQDTVRSVCDTAQHYARIQQIDRSYVPNMIFGKQDIVIAVGQDGMVANVMKYLDGQPLIGINPDPRRWDGILLPFEAGDTQRILLKILEGNCPFKEITMAEAVSKDGQRLLAVNDFFIGCRTHVSARYDISWNQKTESQSSSGIIVSTGLGSTGWMKSIMTEAAAIAAAFGCERIPYYPMPWNEKKLTFAVQQSCGESDPERSTLTKQNRVPLYRPPLRHNL